ncbi:MAG: ABC transporter substrate-binding protein [Gammaproteobacteria bacterium]|nr:ABC transporter substrate-binding protein [Gammaproteobacteria bacterium]
MKNRFGQCVIAILIGLLSINIALAEQYRAPQELVQTVTSDVLSALREINDNDAARSDKVSDKVIELILPHLDFVAMSKLALAKYWRQANKDQQQRFVEQFRDLLVRTYETSLTKYRNEEVKFLPFRESDQPDKKAVVHSEVVRSNGPSIPIDYSLRFKPEDGWKVYDIGIEGVSLVTNYRSSFSREISQHGIDHLISSLQERNSGAEQTNNGKDKEE